MIFINPA